MDLWLALTWGSPIGLGVFFAGLGLFLWSITYVSGHRKPKQ